MSKPKTKKSSSIDDYEYVSVLTQMRIKQTHGLSIASQVKGKINYIVNRPFPVKIFNVF